MADSTEDCNGSNNISREVRGGLISEEVHREAKRHASPVICNFLVAARRGFTSQVIQGLKEGGAEHANTVDKVW